MTRVTTAFLILAGILGTGTAYAQEPRTAEGPVVVTIIPGGATFLTEGKNSGGPSFGNYDLGAGVAGNFNRYVGVEGEISGALGISQTLNGFVADVRTPHLLNYSGNLVVSIPNHSAVTPYVTGGIGGMTLFEKAELGIDTTGTFLTGNAGAGVKWYSGRWGLRGDYRFIAVRAKDDAPNFFGQDTRYAHRLYGGILLNLGR